MIYRFGRFEVDPEVYSFRCDGQVVHLRPRLFDVLVYLIEHRDRVVTYEELLNDVWGSEPASPSAVHWTVSKIRTALGQERGRQSPIETIPRRGYRFTGMLPDAAGRASGRSAEPSAAPRIEGTTLWVDATAEFVGRERVLRVLDEALSATRRGAGGLYLLIGEPGIGKSRCILELACRLAGEGLVWSGICGHGPGAPPLWPWLQVLRACAEQTPPSAPLRRASEELLGALQRVSLETRGRNGASNAFVLLDRIRGILLDAAKSRPRVILLDDLHDADESSLDVLTLLQPHLAASRLMIVATLRQPTLDPQEGTHPRCHEIRSSARCIELPPWSREEVALFVSKSLPGSHNESLVEFLWQRSAGNPLFLQELLRLQFVHESGPPEPGEMLSVRGRRVLPVAVQDLMRRRLQGLRDSTRSALTAASVIGHRFDLALLERVTGEPASALLGALDEALRLGVIERSERASEHAFRHDVIRDVIYTELPGTERTRLHGRVGEALEDPAFGASSASVLAWHFYCASPVGDAHKAVRYAMRAADEARRMSAHSDAARYCEWALEAQAFCPDLDAEMRCDIRIALGQARMELGDLGAGRQHLTRAIEIAEAQDLPRVLAKAGIALRRSMLMASVPDTIALRALEEARRRLPEHELELRSKVASCLSCIPPYTKGGEAQTLLLAEGSSLAARIATSSCLLDAKRATCQTLTGPDHPQALVEAAAELEKLAEEASAAPLLVEGRLYRYFGLLQLGRLREADEIIDSLVKRRGVPAEKNTEWLIRHIDARRAFTNGRLDEAVRRYHALRPRRRSRRSELAEFHWLSAMAFVHLERGSCSEFWPTFVEQTLLWRRRSSTLTGMSIRLLIEAGRRDEATAELDLAPIELLSRKPLRQGQLGCWIHFALAAAALGDRARCHVLYRELLPYAHRQAVDMLWFSLGSTSRALGVLAAALGDAGAARAHFQAAVRHNLECGHRIEAAWSRFGLATVLLRSSEPKLRQSGMQALRDAERDARQMELTALLAAIDAGRPAQA